MPYLFATHTGEEVDHLRQEEEEEGGGSTEWGMERMLRSKEIQK